MPQVLYDEKTEQVFLMLHSGSRNIGNTTAQHYDKAAARDMKQRGIRGPSGLNYLEIASQDGQAYLQVGLCSFRLHDVESMVLLLSELLLLHGMGAGGLRQQSWLHAPYRTLAGGSSMPQEAGAVRCAPEECASVALFLGRSWCLDACCMQHMAWCQGFCHCSRGPCTT